MNLGLGDTLKLRLSKPVDASAERSRVFQSTKELYRAYQLIMCVDDEFDHSDNTSCDTQTDKKRKLCEIFELIFSHVDLQTNTDVGAELHHGLRHNLFTFLGTLPLASLSCDERESIKGVLERCKAAYLLEINSVSSHELWTVLRAQAFALTELCFIPAVYLAGSTHTRSIQAQSLPLIQSAAHVMLMGNIADDWMDFYWIKEDVDRPCYINALLLSEHSTQRYFLHKHMYIFIHMLSRVAREVGTHQYRSRAHSQLSWILPAQALLSLVTGPLNILRWILLRR